MINIDGSLFIQIANFLVLIWILNIVVYRPIRKILIERNERIGGLEKGIENRLKDAQEKDEEFSRGIREARAQGVKEKDALIEEAAAEEKQIIAKINKKAQADLAAVRSQIEKDIDEVRSALQSQVDDFARAIGQKILGRTVS
ncbi:MAG: ATPase [Desulfobacterales bacterium]|nr:ATPase [Desulfobacterales bacterium]MCF8080290.1 ATPase [Desulfobacterales bacterium]